MESARDIFDYLFKSDKTWGFQNFIRDDGQIDTCIRIQSTDDILESTLIKWNDVLHGILIRTSGYLHPEWQGRLNIILKDDTIDLVLPLLEAMIKTRPPHGLNWRIMKAIEIRERVREGCSYPYGKPKIPQGYRT